MEHARIPAPDHLTGFQKRKWAALMQKLDVRQQDAGHAYVTPSEAVWLQGWRVKQPGHTRYPYSVPNEDLSDLAQGTPHG